MYFIALQGTYSSLQLGLFKDQAVVAVEHYEELRASSNLVPFLEEFLKKNNVTLEGLSFIALDKGPGAFTSLRATIASINGIAFARQICLVGVNSLEALQVQACNNGIAKKVRYVVALLNAYNSDAYFRIFDQQLNLLVAESCQKIDEVATTLTALKTPVLCVGNGAGLYRDELEVALGGALHFLTPNPSVPCVTAIASIAFKSWSELKNQRAFYSIEPYYLKTQLFAIKR
jgi:tRNA threonylcarbamoyladenosine biosynthesis protein TsaB